MFFNILQCSGARCVRCVGRVIPATTVSGSTTSRSADLATRSRSARLARTDTRTANSSFSAQPGDYFESDLFDLPRNVL